MAVENIHCYLKIHNSFIKLSSENVFPIAKYWILFVTHRKTLYLKCKKKYFNKEYNYGAGAYC